MFCFGYGKIGHNVKECDCIKEEERDLPEEAYPYSVALKVESSARGKEC